ncbi:hypothetical protein ACFL6S_01425 [Candidatus Poribacteria bacterium]
MKILEVLASVDRRYIFLLIALTVIVPILLPIGMPITVTQEVQSVYDYIEKTPPGSTIIVALDYDPSSLAELYPMTLAVLRHAYSRKIKVLGMTLWNTGAALGQIAMREAAEGIAQEGEDYVYLGFVPQPVSAIMGMGEDISVVFPKDYNGTSTSEMPAMKSVKNYKDIALLIDLAAGSTPEAWIIYAGDTYDQTIAVGCTAVSAVGYYPFLNSNQIIGLIGGMKGAAEYEKLIDTSGTATAGMDSQSIAHIFIILLIVIANISYFAMRKKTAQ